MCACVYTHTHTHTHIYIYIYVIYCVEGWERERYREWESFLRSLEQKKKIVPQIFKSVNMDKKLGHPQHRALHAIGCNSIASQ